MTKYRMYVDETGNSDLKHTDDPNHRFLGLTGVIVDLAHVRETVHPEMESLKARYFGSHPDEPVILHRKELVNRWGPFVSLRDGETRRAFDDDLLRRLREWDYSVVTVCLDKKKHAETYGGWNNDPYHYCMGILLELFNSWLRRRNAKGDVMAESRGKKEDRRLKKEFRNLWTCGTDKVNPEKFQSSLTSRDLKIKLKKDNITGLQLADLIANPSRSQILAERGLLGRQLGEFAKKIADILETKYDRDEIGVRGKSFP